MDYKTYIAGVFSLARSIVIHSSRTARDMNVALSLRHPIPEEKWKWRYYLNLNGVYHHTDEMMYVVSHDTRELIEFTKRNLRNHSITKKAYVFDSDFYKDLVKRYPKQELLIRGIVAPVMMDEALSAEDNTIVSYDPKFVEPQEYTLMPAIQDWVDAAMARWNVRGYGDDEELYHSARLAIIYANIPMAIINHRMSKRKTSEVHSHFVSEYLTSTNDVNKHARHLAREQQLYLYENIKRLRDDIGSEENFEELIENLVKPYGFPLNKIGYRHDTSLMPVRLTAEPKVFLEPYMKGLSVGPQMPEGFYDDAMRNRHSFRPEDYDQALSNMSLGERSRIRTRLLESTCVEYGIEGPFNYKQYAIRQWLAYALNEWYIDEVTITAPKNSQKQTLSVRHAAVIYLFCVARAYGMPLPSLGHFVIPKVKRAQLLSIPEFSTLCFDDYVDETSIDIFTRGQSAAPQEMDRETFNRWLTISYYSVIKQWLMMSNNEHAVERSILQSIFDAQYIDVEAVAADENIEPVIKDTNGIESIYGISLEGYTKDDYIALANTLISSCMDVTVDVGVTRVSDTHKAVVSLINDLTSYNTTVVSAVDNRVHAHSMCVRPRIYGIELTGTRPTTNLPALYAASIGETRRGRISYKYVSPYTLSERLAALEDQVVADVIAGIESLTLSYEEGTQLLEELLG